MIWLAFIGAGLSQVPSMPVPNEPAPGECPFSLPLRAGAALPVSLLDEDGLARCSAVVEPLSSYAHLLAIEEHAKLIHVLYEADMVRMTQQRDFYRDESKVPVHRQPWFVAVTASALVASVFVTYDQVSRSPT